MNFSQPPETWEERVGKLSLRNNIYVSFAVIVVLLIGNGLVSHLGLLSVRDAMARKLEVSRISRTVFRMDRDVQELQLRVDRFVVSGHSSLRDEAGSINRRLLDSIEAVNNDGLDEELDELFTLVGDHIRAYGKQFAAVVEERRVREDLVQVQMPDLSATVQAALGSLAASVEADMSSDQDRLAVTRCQSLFSQAEKSFLRYFATPSTQHVNSAVESLNEARRSIASLAGKKVVGAMRGYETTGLRAVQATRSYLFLRNVVMAAEASEVGYYAESLRLLAEERRNAIRAEALATGRCVNQVTVATIAIATVLATLIAARLAYLTIPPLTAITEAFTKLSGGKTLEDIPGTDREDEIGAMATAARVFSDRNQQTRELLSQSESMREELQVQAVELAATNRELDNFAYVASHDLKSPLRGIRQLASWIEEDAADKLPPASLEHLQHMQSRVAKMEALLAGLLEYSRVGRLAPKVEQVDVKVMVASIAELTNNPGNVAFHYPDELPRCSTLRAPLEQVLMNLIGNAIKYNHRGSEGIVELDWQTRDDFYHVTVNDNGPGIHGKDHERIFQMYQRVGDADIEGSGMGLALVKKQIEQMGGEVRIESAIGEGARFEFTWPVQVIDSSNAS